MLYLKYPAKFPKSNVPTKIGEKGALGVKVDESIDTVRAGVSDIIQGWDLGIARACQGEQRKIMMSVDMAYGAAGAFRVIPPQVRYCRIWRGIRHLTPFSGSTCTGCGHYEGGELCRPCCK